MPLVPTNAMVADPQDDGQHSRFKPGKNVYIRDVATIQDTTDINYGCALVNGRQVDLHPRGQEGHGIDLDRGAANPRFDAAVPVGGARGRERPLRVRRIADGAGGHQERRDGGS